MEENYCPQCGAPLEPGAAECRFCGERIVRRQAEHSQPQPQTIYAQQPQHQTIYTQQPQPQTIYVQQPQSQTIYVQQPQPIYVQQPQPIYVQQPQPIYVQQTVTQQVHESGINSSWPVKSKVVAGLLGICLGGFGIHKFYMGKIGMGILYLLFCWTGIPAIVGFVEGITYLFSNKENFQLKHHVRLK